MKIRIREEIQHANKVEIELHGNRWVIREGADGLRVGLASQKGAKRLSAKKSNRKDEIQITLER